MQTATDSSLFFGLPFTVSSWVNFFGQINSVSLWKCFLFGHLWECDAVHFEDIISKGATMTVTRWEWKSWRKWKERWREKQRIGEKLAMFIKQPKIALWREKSTYKNVHSFSQSFLLFFFSFRFFFFVFHLSAPVSRIAKYFRQDGTPLITVGGYTYDFVQNKTTCDDEYHMLIRVGLLSFETIADFTVDIMKKWVPDYRISSLSVIYKTAFCNPFSSVSIFFASLFLFVAFMCFVQFLWHSTHIDTNRAHFWWTFPFAFFFRSPSARKLVAYSQKTVVSCILIAVPFNGGSDFYSLFFSVSFEMVSFAHFSNNNNNSNHFVDISLWLNRVQPIDCATRKSRSHQQERCIMIMRKFSLQLRQRLAVRLWCNEHLICVPLIHLLFTAFFIRPTWNALWASVLRFFFSSKFTLSD